MTMQLFPRGKEALLDGTINFNTDTIKAALHDLATADAAVKAITGATNATPIVITSTAHGFANGDIVVILGVGGATAANNVWKVKTVLANTFELADVVDGTTNSVGNGVYTSGGIAVCLGPSAAGDHWDDFDLGVVGTPGTLATKTVAAGVADAADQVFTAVTGNQIKAVLVYEDTAVATTSRMLAFNDGKHKVTAAATAAAAATAIVVEPLAAPIASGATLIFSNGASATLSAGAALGARSLAVTALAAQVTAGSYASADAQGSNLPLTPNGGNITIAWDNGAFRIFAL